MLGCILHCDVRVHRQAPDHRRGDAQHVDAWITGHCLPSPTVAKEARNISGSSPRTVTGVFMGRRWTNVGMTPSMCTMSRAGTSIQ